MLTPRMNPGLPMSDGLLKGTGAANLFMVFGEPDIEVKKVKDGNMQGTAPRAFRLTVGVKVGA